MGSLGDEVREHEHGFGHGGDLRRQRYAAATWLARPRPDHRDPGPDRRAARRITVAKPASVVHDAPVTKTRRTLVDLLEGAAARYGDRTALEIRRDDGAIQAWSYRELDRRSRLAAWRLRSRGLQPGDRLLTWSTSCPELAAVYFGAMRAGLILVPLDLRMAPTTIRRIADRSGARQLAIGTGRDAPDPSGVRPRPPAHRHDRRPVRRAGRRLSRRLGDHAGILDAPRPGRSLPARLHFGHDRHAQGSRPGPREHDGGSRRVPPDRPGHGIPRRVRAPAGPPLRAGDRAVLHPRSRRPDPLRPDAQPAGGVRVDP